MKIRRPTVVKSFHSSGFFQVLPSCVEVRRVSIGVVHAAHFDLGVQVDHAVLVGGQGLFLVVEELAFARLADLDLGDVVDAQHHVVRGIGDRAARRGGKDVVGGHHQHARFHLRFLADGHVHGHLVAVEVGVERRAGQRVQLDG